jgi:hypothetical protein
MVNMLIKELPALCHQSLAVAAVAVVAVVAVVRCSLFAVSSHSPQSMPCAL